MLGPQDADAGGQLEITENPIGHVELRRRVWSGPPVKLAEYPDLDTALQAADHHIRERYLDRLLLLSKRARWREEAATEKQLRLLEALDQPLPRARGGAVVLTKGQAQLLIDRALVLRRARRTPVLPISVASSAPERRPEPATARQRRYLRFLSVPAPPGLTKKEARRLISNAKKARQSKTP